MSIRKIKQSWWVDFRFNHQRYRKRSPDNSRAGAAAYEALLRRKLSEGIDINAEKVSEITVVRIEEYKAKKRDSGLSAKTINNHMVILRKALQTAHEWELLISVPKIKMLRVEPAQIVFLTGAECGALIDAQSDPMVKTLILTALHTGMRMGELCALSWEDINFAANPSILTVARSVVRGVVSSPKSNKIRHIPLSNELRDALMGMCKKHGNIFLREGKVIGDRSMSVMLTNACKRAGIRSLQDS